MAWLAQGGLASVPGVTGGIACQPLRSRSCAIAELIRLKKIRIDPAGPAFPVEHCDFLLRLCPSRRLRHHSIYPACNPNMSSYRRSRAQPHRTCLRGNDEPMRSDHCGPRGAPFGAFAAGAGDESSRAIRTASIVALIVALLQGLKWSRPPHNTIHGLGQCLHRHPT